LHIVAAVWGRSGRARMVDGFTITYAISAYHHLSCEFKPHSVISILGIGTLITLSFLDVL
jgi:hypothetical protein